MDKNTRTQTETVITFEDQQLANELHNPLSRKFQKRKVYSSYQSNIWGANLADMQILAVCY